MSGIKITHFTFLDEFIFIQPCSGLTWGRGPGQEMASPALDLPLWYWGQVGSAQGDSMVKKNTRERYAVGRQMLGKLGQRGWQGPGQRGGSPLPLL